MATSDANPNHEHIDSLLDQIIKDFMTDTGAEPHREDSLSAAIAEGAMVMLSRYASRASAFEKAVLADMLAHEIAEALAPALARAVAPEILAALNRIEMSTHKTPDSQEPSGRRR